MEEKVEAGINATQTPNIDSPQARTPLNLDIFETNINTGMPYFDMSKELMSDDTLKPMREPAFYMEKYGDKFSGEEEFKSRYTEALNAYDHLNENKYRQNLTLVGFEKFGLNRERDPNFGNYTTKSLNLRADVYSFNATENPLLIETNAQNAGRGGTIVEPSFHWDEEKGWLKGVRGATTRQGKLTFGERLLGGYYVTPTMDDNEEPIVDQWGRQQYHYEKFPEIPYVLSAGPKYNLEKASIFGDQKLYSRFFLNPLIGLADVATIGLVQDATSMGNVFKDAVFYTALGEERWDELKESPLKTKGEKLNPLARWNALASNYNNTIIEGTEASRFQPSQAQASDKFFGDGIGGFAYNLGVGLGYIIPQRFAATALVKGAGVVSKGALRFASMSIGSTQATAGFYQSARQAGLTAKDAAYMSMLALPAVASTEWALNSKWLTVGLGVNEQKLVTNRLKSSMEYVSKLGLDPKTPKGMAMTLKKAFKDLGKDQSFVDVLTGKRIVGPAIMEGTQESLEEVWYSILETAWDRGWFKDLESSNYGEGSFGGSGKFRDLFSEEQLSRYWDNWVGGAIVGGIMDAGMLGHKDRHRENIFEEMIVRGETSNLLNFVDNAFKSGKLGVPHRDTNNEVFTVDEQGNSQGNKFTVPEDVSFQGDVLFKKGQELSTMNEMSYYQTVMDVLSKHEVVTASGLNNPETLKRFTGQEALLVGAFRVWKEMDAAQTEKKRLEASLSEEGANKGEIEAKINDLTATIEGVVDENGKVLRQGLRHEFDFLTKPVEGSNRSAAYILNVKHGVANGLLWNKASEAYESGARKFDEFSKDEVYQYDDLIKNLKEIREKEKVSKEYFEEEQATFGQLETMLGDMLAGKDFDIGDIFKKLSDAKSILTSRGIDSRLLDNVSKNIVESAQKYTAQVNSAFAEHSLEYNEAGEDVGLAIDFANMERPESEKISVDPNVRNSLSAMSNVDKVLNDLSNWFGDDQTRVTREEGVLTPGQDKSIIEQILWLGKDGKLLLYADKLIDIYDNQENLSAEDVQAQIPMLQSVLDKAGRVLDYSESINEAKGRDNEQGIFEHEPATEVNNNDVTPGRDIPQPYIADLRAKNKSLTQALERIIKRVDYDAKSIAKNEKKRNYASNLQKAYMLSRMWEYNANEFEEIAAQLGEVRTMSENLGKKGWDTEQTLIDELAKKIRDVESWIYSKANKDSKFQKKMMENIFLDNPFFARLEYYSVADNQLAFYYKRNGALANVNDSPFEEMYQEGAAIFADVLFMRMNNYINSIVNINSNLFYQELDNALKDPDNKRPGVEQIDQIRLIATAAAIQHTGGKFMVKVGHNEDSKIIDHLDNPEVSGIVPHRSVSIDGSGGVGKTTVIASLGFQVVNSLFDKMGVSASSIAVAPSKDMTTVLSESISGNDRISVTSTLDYPSFIRAVKGQKGFSINKKSILIIDESSRVSMQDMREISRLAADNDVLVIYLGDSMQATEKDAETGHISKWASNQRQGIRSSRINMKFRTGIAEIGNVQDAIAFTIKGSKTIPSIFFPRVSYTKDHKKGVRYVETVKEIQDAFLNDLSNEGENRVIIFETKAQADVFKNSLVGENERFRKNVRYVMRKGDQVLADEGTVQGQEFKYVYVAFNDPGPAPEVTNTDRIYGRRIFLTAMSRAQSFVMMPVNASMVGFSTVAEPSEIVDQSEDISRQNNERAVESQRYVKMMAGGTAVSENPVVHERAADSNLGTSDAPIAEAKNKRRTKKKKGPERVSDPDHELSNLSVYDVRNGRQDHVIDVQTLGGSVDRIIMSSGKIFEGPSAQADFESDYASTRFGIEESTQASISDYSGIESAIADRRPGNRFISSALAYHSDMAIPTLINVHMIPAGKKENDISADEFFSRYGKAKATVDPLNGDYDLVYMKKVSLMTEYKDKDGNSRYRPKDHYNVVAVMDGSKLIGVLPDADTGFSDANNSSGKEFSSQKDVDYSAASLLSNKAKIAFDDPNPQWNEKLRGYHSALIDIRTVGFEAAKTATDPNNVVLGSITYAPGKNRLGGTVYMSEGPKGSIENPSPLLGQGGFIERMEAKGVVFEKVGEEYVVFQKSVNGTIRWHLRGSYIHSSTDRNKAYPIDSIAIPVAPRVITQEDKSDIRDSIRLLREMPKDDGAAFITALKRSEAFQFLRANTSKLTHISQLERKVLPRFGKLLTYDAVTGMSTDGKIDILGIRELGYNEIIDRLSDAVNLLIKDSSKGRVYAWYPVKTINGVSTISRTNKLVTHVGDIRSPYYRGVVTMNQSVSDLSSRPNSASQADLDNEVDETWRGLEESFEGLAPVHAGNAVWASKTDAISYIRQVLGDEYVSEFLEFNTDPTKDNRRYWGYVQGLRMVLRSAGDMTTQQAFRHEPVHIIIDNLVTQKKRAQLYAAVRSHLNSPNLSDKDANEAIARMHQNKELLNLQYKGLKGVLQRFLDFLGNTFASLKSDRAILSKFFNDIESGSFANKIKASDKALNNQVSFLAYNTLSTKVQQNNVRFSELGRQFGGHKRLQSASRYALHQIKHFSAANGLLDSNGGNFISAIDKAKENILGSVRANNLATKFAKIGPSNLEDVYDDPAFRGMTPKQVELNYIKHMLSQGNNLDIIVKHLFPGIDKVSDEYDSQIKRGYNESSMSDPEIYASDIVKAHLHTIPYYQFTAAGKVASTNDSTKFYVDYNLLKKHLVYAMMEARQYGNSSIEEVFRVLRTMADAYGSTDVFDNESRNTILSFLEEFGKTYRGKNLKEVIRANTGIKDSKTVRPRLSHYMLSEKKDDIANVLSEMRAAGEITEDVYSEKMAVLDRKAEVSGELLNAVLTAMNLRAVDFVTVSLSYENGIPSFSRSIYHETSSAMVKRYLRGSMEMEFMSGDRTYLESALSRVNGTARGVKAYEFSETEIKRKNYGNILKFRNGKWQWQNADQSWQIEAAKTMLNFFGIDIRPSTITQIFRADEIKSRYRIDGDMLADYLGNMVTSIYAHPQFLGDNKALQSKLQDRMGEFLGTIRVKPQDTGDRGAVMLTDFYPLLDALADIQGFIAGKVSPHFSRSVSGDMKSNLVLPSRGMDVFANDPGGKNASDKIVSHVTSEIDSDLSPEATNLNPLVTIQPDGTRLFNDSLLDRKRSEMSIVSVSLHNGIDLLHRHVGTDISDFTIFDYYNSMINGLFRESVYQGHQNQLLAFTPENLGDSGQLPIFNVSFGGKDQSLISITETEDGPRGIVHDAMINKHIDIMFDYHRKASLVSTNKWYNLLKGEVRFKDRIDQESYLENQPDAVENIRKELIKHVKAINSLPAAEKAAFVKKVKASNLNNFRDYRIDKAGNIMLGQATNMDHDIFSRTNYTQWKRNADRNAFRDRIFLDRFKNLARVINNEIVGVPADIAKMMSNVFEEKTISRSLKSGKIVPSKQYKWNPFYKAFFYGYFIVNNSVSNLALGNEGQFESSETKSKRNKGYNSSGLRGVIGGHLNLPEKTNVVRISDKMGNYDQLKQLFPEQNNSFKETDGMELSLPIVAKQLSHSLGGQYAMTQYNDVSIKVFHHTVDYKTHTASQDKLAQLVITEDYYRDTEHGKSLVKWMLTHGPQHGKNNVNLSDVFDGIMSKERKHADGTTRKPTYDEGMNILHRWISDYDKKNPNDRIHDNYVGIVSYASTNKTENGAVNDVAIDKLSYAEEVAIEQRDNTSVYFQLNLNHEVSKEVSRANQLESNIGAVDINAARIVDNINAAYVVKNEKAIQRAIKKAGGFKPFLKKIGIESVERIGRANVLGDLFANKNIDVSLPMLMNTAMNAYISKVNQGINPKAVGTKMVQMPSAFNLIEVKDSAGNVFFATKSEASKYEKTGNSAGLKHYRFLDSKGKEITEEVIGGYNGDYHGDLSRIDQAIREYRRYSEPGYPQDDITKKRIAVLEEEVFAEGALLDKMKDFLTQVRSKVGFISPSQIAMNFPYRNEFRLNATETLNEALTLTVGDASVNVRALVKGKMNPRDYYNRDKRNKVLVKELVAIMKDLPEGFMHRGYTSKTEVVNYFASLLDSLVIYGTRVPTSHVSAAFYGEIEFFTPHSKNVVYISSEKNLFDGSDYDIDELSIYFKDIIGDGGKAVNDPNYIPIIRSQDASKSMDPETISPEQMAEFDYDILNNIKHDQILGVYTNPENLELITSSIDIQGFRDAVSDKRENEIHTYNNDFATAAYNFVASQEGKNMVSRFANAILAYTRLSRMGYISPGTVPGLFSDEGVLNNRFPNVEYVISRTNNVLTTLARVLQASVDNPKEFVLGYLNINRASGNLVTALVMSGMTERQISEFLSRPVVARTINSAFSSFSSNRRTKDMLSIIDSKMRTLQEKYIDSDISIGAQEIQNRWEHMVRQLIKAKEKELEVQVDLPAFEGDEVGMDDNLLQGTAIADDIEKTIQEARQLAQEQREDYLDSQIDKYNKMIGSGSAYAEIIETKRRKDAEEKMADLQTMKEMFFLGEFVWRITQGFTIYTGLPSKDVDRFNLIQNLEFNLGMPLSNYVGDTSPANTGWLAHGDNIPGVNNEARLFGTQQDVNGYVNDLFDAINGDPLINPGSVKFVIGGSNGFESAMLAQMDKAGYEVEAYLPKDGRVLLSNGKSNYAKKDDQRFEVDEDSASERRLKQANTGRSALTINFNAMVSSSDSDNLNGPEKVVKNIHPAKDNPAQIKEVLGYIRDVIRANKSQEPVKIHLTGSTLFRIKTKPKSDYEHFMEVERSVRAIGDISQVYKSLPNIDYYIKALYAAEKRQEIFYNKSPFVKSIMAEYMQAQRLNRMSSSQYIGFQDSVQEFVLDMFFNQLNVKFDLGNLPGLMREAGDVGNKEIDLSNYDDREYFVMEFADSVRRLKEVAQADFDHPLHKNEFLMALDFTGGRIYFDHTFFDDIQVYRDAFERMADRDEYKPLAQMFKYYNILIHGFKFEFGSYREAIGDSFFEDVSAYVSKINNQLVSKKNNTAKKRFKQYFLPNALLANDRLTNAYWDNHEGFQNMKDSDIYPAVYRERKYNVVEGTNKIVGSFWSHRVYLGNGQYDTVYANTSRKIKNLPSNRRIESRNEVVRLDNIENFRQIRSANQVTEKSFDKMHGYTDGSEVFVNGRLAKLRREGAYRISLRVLEYNPNSAYESILKARQFEDSLIAVINDIDSIVDEEIRIDYSQKTFVVERGGGIYYNPKLFNPEKSRIADLFVINAAILKAYDLDQYNSVLDIVNSSDHYADMTDIYKVAVALGQRHIFSDEAQINVLDNARRTVLQQIAYNLDGSTIGDVTFEDSMNDLIRANESQIKESQGPARYNQLMQVEAQYSMRMQLITDEVAQNIVDRLGKQFGVKTLIISENRARELYYGNRMVPNAFFLNGVAYYVSGKIRQDTPIHELLHPFINSLEIVNPKLFDSLIAEMESSTHGKNVLEYVNMKYADRGIMDRKKEALVQLMGEQAARIIPQNRNKGLVGKLHQFWSWVTTQLKQLFTTQIQPNLIRPDAKIEDIIKMIASGRRIGVSSLLSDIAEEQRTNMSASDLPGALLVPEGHADINEQKLATRINYIYADIARTENKTYTLFTPEGTNIIDFSAEFAQGKDAVLAAIRTNILPLLENEESFRKKRIIDWINNTENPERRGSLKSESLNEFFSVPGHRRWMFDPDVLKQFKNLIHQTSATQIMPYSELNNYFEGTKFAGMFNEKLSDRDPWIIVHREVNDDNGNITELDISILDIHFGNSNTIGKAGRYLFTNYLSDVEQEKLGLNAGNTLDEVRKLQMGLMAMKIKEVGGADVNIRSLGIVNMTRSKLTTRMADTSRIISNIAKISKVPEFANHLDAQIRDLIMNEKLHDPMNYFPNFINMMRFFLYDEQSNLLEKGKAESDLPPMLKKNIDVIDRYVDGLASKEELIAMLEYRRDRLHHSKGIKTITDKMNSEEYAIISEILGSMKGYQRDPLRNRPTAKDASFYEQWIVSIHDVRNEALQDVYAVIRENTKIVTDAFVNDFRTPFQELIRKMNPVIYSRIPGLLVGERFADIGHKRFDRLFKKKQVLGTDGRMHEINTFEIHYEMNAEAIAAGLSEQEIALGKFVVDNIEKYMKHQLRHVAMMSGDFYQYDEESVRHLNKEKLDAYVDEQYNQYWRPGMLPLMMKTGGQHLASGNLGKAMERWWKRMANPVAIFDEVMELTESSGLSDQVRSFFLTQFSGDATLDYGSSIRAEMLGFELGADGQYVLNVREGHRNGLKMNNDINTNLEDVMDYFVMDSLWKPQMDAKVMPEYHGALVRLNTLKILTGHSQINNQDQLQVIFDKIVHGKHKLEHNSKQWENVAAATNVLYKMTTFNGVALSIPVAVTSAVGNLTEANLHALASMVGNPYDTFTWPTLQKAQFEMIKNPKKVEALTNFYQITEKERFDVLSNQRYKVATNHMWSSRTMHYMNWITDYSVRQLVMVAQMMHDGTWEAHSIDDKGKVTYDAKKDKRFFNADGSFAERNPEGKLHKWVARNLSNDPRVNQKAEELPQRAYDLQDQSKFEWISNYFVTGTYNQESTGAYDSYIMAKLVAQFKKFLVSKIEQRVGAHKKKAVGGWKVIVEDESGKLHEVWQELETGGAYTEVVNYLWNDVLKPLHRKDMKMVRGWKDMSPLQKYSSARTGLDALMFAAIWALFTGLGKLRDPDDDDLIGKLTDPESRLLRAVKSGWMTALAVTPGEFFETMSLPTWEQAKRIWTLVSFNGTSTDLRRMLPGTATFQTFDDVFDFLGE